MYRRATILLAVALVAAAIWAAYALAQAPVASFTFSPANPSVADTVQFTGTSTPTPVLWTWDFGDGATSTIQSPAHHYAADGDYTVALTVTSSEGTSAFSQVVPVRSHDVGITKVAAPKSVKVGKTGSTTVSVRSFRYPESVQVELLVSVAGDGFRSVGTLTQAVPAVSGNATTKFKFTYEFQPSDAGTLTFKAVATIQGPRDYDLSNNEMLASPTNVK